VTVQTTGSDTTVGAKRGTRLVRALGWPDAFWIATGVPALLVFSVGSIAVLAGPVSALIWVASVLIGLAMAFVYAEMAGMFPEKSGGPPVFGSQAWSRYVNIIAPVNMWGYWFAWSPVISIGGLLMGGYIQAQWFSNLTWSLGFGPNWGPNGNHLFTITFATVVGAAIIVALLWLNNFGIRQSAIMQLVLAVTSLIPLALLIVVPLVKGQVNLAYFQPFVPPNGQWLSWNAFAIVAAGLFVAGWSAYAFETAVVYTAEFRKPQVDTPRAIFSAGLLCLFFFGLGPFVLLGVVGPKAIQQDPSTALVPLAKAVFGVGGQFLIALLLVAILLSINTAILGSSRTLYQGGKDGWTLRFMRFTSRKGVPLRAMQWDIVINLFLMLFGSPIWILAASTVGYFLFNVLNLVAGFLLRKDAAGVPRPYRAPRLLIRFGLVLAAVNLILLFVGAPSWGWVPVGLGYLIVLTGVAATYVDAWVEGRGATGRRLSTAAPRTAAVGTVPEKEAEVDPLGPWRQWADLTPMILYLLVTGAIFTLAVWQGFGWAYILGLALTVIWLLGFVVPRGEARWFAW
jgi:amino acid transporter